MLRAKVHVERFSLIKTEALILTVCFPKAWATASDFIHHTHGSPHGTNKHLADNPSSPCRPRRFRLQAGPRERCAVALLLPPRKSEAEPDWGAGGGQVLLLAERGTLTFLASHIKPPDFLSTLTPASSQPRSLHLLACHTVQLPLTLLPEGSLEPDLTLS